MTVSELIKKLKQYPQDMLVVVTGYESGYDDIESIESEIAIVYDPVPDWDGKYTNVEDVYDDQDMSNIIKAVHLSRY